MVLKIDFNSDEAIYIQLRNQIIMGIATEMIHEGDTLPSVRQMADHIGINMHTVNKAYSVLRQEGYVKLDRRRGAVVSLDVDKIEAMETLRSNLNVVLACGICKNIKYTEIINGVKTEHNLCSHCAREMDFGQYTAFIDGDFPLGRLLSGLLGLADDEEETEVRGRVVCPTCGTSFDDFVENSRFGCPDCYGVFDLFINDKMKQLQGSESHKGKHPKFRSKFEKEHPDSVKKGGNAAEDSAGAEVLSFGPENFEGGGDAALAKKIRELDRKLKEALREEAYEEAAAYRDQIRALKAEAGAKAGTGAKASADAKAGAGADSANSAKASAGEEAAAHE